MASCCGWPALESYGKGQPAEVVVSDQPGAPSSPASAIARENMNTDSQRQKINPPALAPILALASADPGPSPNSNASPGPSPSPRAPAQAPPVERLHRRRTVGDPSKVHTITPRLVFFEHCD